MLAEAPEQTAAAERWLQEAGEVSHRQQAKTLELRATVSLSRLWQTQGKLRQARRALKALYDQFSEGFDTVDLRTAKSLFDDSVGQTCQKRLLT
jgi:predicted ATPase